MSKAGETATFTYNADGLRVKKVCTTTGTTNYTLHGKNLVHLSNSSNNLHFFYDAQNRPAVVVFNGTAYGYVHNLQGDIIAIVNSAGTKVVEYTYDAWGRTLSKTGSMASTLGTLNPFRYRGYIYDEETGLFYLRSRNYSTTWNRFLNADILLTRNMYRYCKNSPCNLSDHSGMREDDSEWSILDQPGVVIKSDPPAVSQADAFFNMHYLPQIMSYLRDPADYAYPPFGSSDNEIDCSNLMIAITGSGSGMARFRFSRFSGNKGQLFHNGKLTVDLVVGMEVFKPSTRSDGTKVENGHVGMLMKYDFGDGEGEVWAVFQSVSTGVQKTTALFPAGSDPDFGPNITKFYQNDGSCKWVNYTDPRYYNDPLYTGGR